MPIIDLDYAFQNYKGINDGGLKVTPEMKKILAKPGFIKVEEGGQRLRNLYVDGSMHFDAMRLSPFGLCCYVGHLSLVQLEVEAGRAPDLNGTETGYQFGYATLIIAGAQRVEPDPHSTTQHLAVLKYLISRGLPLNTPDIAGLTALHHAVGSAGAFPLELARALLEAGADVNAQSRYGEVPLFSAFMQRRVRAIELLMEFGADLDLEEADGTTPRGMLLSFGPETTAVVQKWIRRRAGEEPPPREEKRCDGCRKAQGPLKNCGRCQIARYCSVECQRKAWPEHKKSCHPFSSSNTLTFKPSYHHGLNIIPTQELADKFFGITPDTASSSSQHRHRSAHTPKQVSSRNGKSKNLIIKVQIPYSPHTNQPTPGAGPFLVYTKKRDLVCQVHRRDGPQAYDALARIVGEKGVGGCKAYFAAELVSREELVVKTEVLAEQPF